MSRRFIVRGEPTPDAPARCAAARSSPALARWHHRPATLRAAAHHWIALDIDGSPVPSISTRPKIPMRRRVRREHLSPSSTAQPATGNSPPARAEAGAEPPVVVLRPAAVRRRAKDHLADSPVDHAIFAPAQPIYTAAPIFVDIPDPLGWKVDPGCGKRQGRGNGSAGAAAPLRVPASPAGPLVAMAAEEAISTIAARSATMRAVVDSSDRRKRPSRRISGGMVPPLMRLGCAMTRSGDRAADSSKHDAAYLEMRIRDLEPLIAAIGRGSG